MTFLFPSCFHQSTISLCLYFERPLTKCTNKEGCGLKMYMINLLPVLAANIGWSQYLWKITSDRSTELAINLVSYKLFFWSSWDLFPITSKEYQKYTDLEWVWFILYHIWSPITFLWSTYNETIGTWIKWDDQPPWSSKPISCYINSKGHTLPLSFVVFFITTTGISFVLLNLIWPSSHIKH